jgi:hypothetical protein
MNEKEMRAELARLEAQNASLKKQKALSDKIAALEAENADLDARIADGGAAAAGAAQVDGATAVTSGGAAAEPTAVTKAVPAAETAADDAESATQVVVVRKGSRLRSTLVSVLVVLTCISVVVTGVAWWVHYSVFNTKGYINLVGPIGKDPQAIKNLSDYVAGQVVTATDLQAKTAAALPTNAQFLAGPISSGVTTFIANGTNKVLSTPQAYDLWIKINTVAHEQIVALLRGQTTYTYIQGSDVKLDTLPLISQVLVWVDGKLPGALGTRFSPPVIAPGTPPDQAIQQVSTWTGRTLPADFGQITLLQNDALGPAKTAVHLFDTLVWVLLVAMIVLIAVTIGLSRHRRRTLIELGIGAAVALILTRVIVKQGSSLLVSKIETGNGASMVKDVVSASLGPLTTLTIWIVVIGVVVAVVAWFSGRRDLQVAVVKAGKSVVKNTDPSVAAYSPTVNWITEHLSLLRLAGLAIGLILIVFAASGWFAIILLLFIVLLYEGVLSLVARSWPFRHEMRGDTAG